MLPFQKLKLKGQDIEHTCQMQCYLLLYRYRIYLVKLSKFVIHGIIIKCLTNWYATFEDLPSSLYASLSSSCSFETMFASSLEIGSILLHTFLNHVEFFGQNMDVSFNRWDAQPQFVCHFESPYSYALSLWMLIRVLGNKTNLIVAPHPNL